ncbi:phospholipase D family protein [Neisseria dumasiana]|uniref:DNA repair protein n=1 Tax=Neisseria dumasiana TaxID=1931275 RepID=A0A1X3DKT7_9NEIS|nr:phospholipase D family protein [Neisseria dumasiana]OSI25002.1 DNA repair protein [Neisseria dumasiana]OSI36298.1 DNA repair protein [Neisseria dumasiana]UOO84201.1 phospholipase D family protein [Neisseria dumasiana]
MSKFLNTSATTYYLEELIKNARERLYLISPYLKLNDRIKELLEDKDRMKIDIRIVYGKSELQPAEVNWLKNLNYIRISYCHNLHAKCYISETACIITSLNLYEFSQVNNNEMGILIGRDEDIEVYQDAYNEAQRIIRISDEVKISLDVIDKSFSDEESVDDTEGEKTYSSLTAAKLAEKLGISTAECNQKLCDCGLQELNGKFYNLTENGKKAGGMIKKGRYGYFIVWPENLNIS